MQLLQDIHEQIWLHSVPRQLRHQQVPLRLWRQLLWDLLHLFIKLRKRQIPNCLLRVQCWILHLLQLMRSRLLSLRLQRPQWGLLSCVPNKVSAAVILYDGP